MFRRLDAKSGAVRWETNVRPNAAPQYFFHGDMLLALDRIVVGADVEVTAGVEAGLHAFDRGSGRQVWMHRTGRGVPGPTVGTERRAFAYTAAGTLVAVDLDSGKVRWSHALKASSWEGPAVLGDRVFAGSGDGSVYAFHSETGRVEWQQKVGAPVTSSVLVSESGVYAGTADGVIHRLRPNSGEPLSALKLDAVLKPLARPVVTRHGIIVLLADQKMDYRVMVSVDPTLTRITWRQPAPDRWTTSRIFATTKTLWLGTPSGELSAYCAADGSLAWSHKLSASAIRAVGGSDDVLYVGTPQGTLYAVRPLESCP